MNLYKSLTVGFSLLTVLCASAQQTAFFEHIKTEDGLSNNTINCITQDSLGNMWFGTYDGLNCYNGQIITVFKHSSQEPEISLANNKIEKLVTDGDGTLWIGMANNLVARFVNGRPQHFIHYNLAKYQSSTYNDLRVGEDGCLIVDYANVSLRYNASIDAFEQTLNRPVVDATLQRLKSLFPHAGIEKICERRKGEYWLSTRKNGIVVAKQSSNGRFEITVVNQQISNSHSLSNNEVYDIYLDKFGVLWVGTKDGGVNRLIESAFALHSISHDVSSPQSLPRGTIRSISEDASGNVWIGTYSDGVAIYSKNQGMIGQINHPHNNVLNQDWDRVRSIYRTSDNSMWIGSYNGLCRVMSNGSRVYYTQNDKQLKHGRIYGMTEDKDAKLWICGWDGIEKFDLRTSKFEPVELPALKGLHCRTIYRAMDGAIWIGTEYDGMFVYNPATQAITQIKQASDKSNSLGNNSVFSIVQDNEGVFWIATADGLSCYNSENKQFKNFTTFDGLMSNLVLGVMVDNKGDIWASTSVGVSCIHQQTLFVSNYNRQDGWINDELTEGAFFKGKDGSIYVGGTLGVNYLHPDSLVHDGQAPDVFVEVENNSDALLLNSRKSILKIDYFDRENKILLHAVQTNSPRKNVVAWRIPAQNLQWTYNWSSSAVLSMANLLAGDYELEYKAANNSGVWSPIKTLHLRINPPIWQNKWMWMLLITILLSAIFLFYHLRLRSVRKYNRELARLVDERTSKIQQQSELLEAQNQKLQASNQDILKQKDQILAQRDHLGELHQKLKDETVAKMNFLANVSHELRTPLTLIKGPVDRLLQVFVSQADVAVNQKLLETIKEQIDYLLTLVDQTLDYKKIESGHMSLNFQVGDVLLFCRDVIDSFMDEVSKLNISLNFESEVAANWLKLDYEKLKIVLNNLLSNAIKFTPADGQIVVRIFQLNNELCVEVADSGIGIPEDCIDFIFDRYYQIGRAVNSIMKGSGIGLALVKEIVLLHGGDIEVISKQGQGSTFTIKLPVEVVPLLEDDFVTDEVVIDADNESVLPSSSVLPVVLLVEDHQKMREYIDDLLQNHHFSVLTAQNGAEAMRMLKHHKVELILSDWMMPVMDGIELCKKVKLNSRTRHIPFVLFTAKNSNGDHEKALEYGANDFITKPFSEKVLIRKLNTLITRDQNLLDAFKTQQQIVAIDEVEPTEDEKLLGRMVQVINDHIAESTFNPDELCELLGLSKMKLYRKCKQLTGLAPIELIRSIRIKRAAQLLGNRGFTISEVGFKVGFNDPKYFSRCFQKEFQMTPSQFQEQKTKLVYSSSY